MNQGLLLATMEPMPGFEEEFNDWYDTEHVPERVGVVKPGDVVCALSLLTGAKATQTVIASTAARAPPKMKALEINKKCLRAVVMRRPTVLDAMARVVAADEIGRAHV